MTAGSAATEGQTSILPQKVVRAWTAEGQFHFGFLTGVTRGKKAPAELCYRSAGEYSLTQYLTFFVYLEETKGSIYSCVSRDLHRRQP
jgi:hypothetical protein